MWKPESRVPSTNLTEAVYTIPHGQDRIHQGAGVPASASSPAPLKTYGRTVQYQAEINGTKASAYLPVEWFPGSKYPSQVVMAVAVPDNAKWDKD